MAMMLYQYIGIIIGIIGIIYSFLRFRDSKMSLGMLFVWSIIWVILIGLSLDPLATGYFASLTGIGRGLDVVLILGLIGSFYLIFRIYNTLENMEQEITHLVREIALMRENRDIESKEDEEDNSK
ncbi:MAG: DUF2304 family protein [Methanobacterium sp.]|nr:DUF2304 family protein [Methanobacterium sp.]